MFYITDSASTPLRNRVELALLFRLNCSFELLPLMLIKKVIPAMLVSTRKLLLQICLLFFRQYNRKCISQSIAFE